MSTRAPPVLNWGSGGNSGAFAGDCSIVRKADSTRSDIVRPCLAASRFKRIIVTSLMESVVFIWKTIRHGCECINLPLSTSAVGSEPTAQFILSSSATTWVRFLVQYETTMAQAVDTI